MLKLFHCIICMSSRVTLSLCPLLCSDCTSHFSYTGTKMYLIVLRSFTMAVVQLLAKAHSWLTIQLHFKGREVNKSIYNCITLNQNLRDYSSEEPLSKESIFKEPRNHFGVSLFLCEHTWIEQNPQVKKESLLSPVGSFPLSTISSISPSKFFLTDILVSTQSLS